MKKFYLWILMASCCALGPAAHGECGDVENCASFESNCNRAHLFGSMLYWYASEETSSTWANAISADVRDGRIYDTFSAENINFDWNYGFRAGAAYTLNHDLWNTRIYWTHYTTNATKTASDALILTEFFGGFIAGEISDWARIKWKLNYNTLDWDISRNFHLCKGLTLKPYFGIKGAWIDQSIRFNSHVILQDNQIVDYNSKERLKNDFWGLGPSIGLSGDWQFFSRTESKCCLISDFSCTTMWGNWNFEDEYEGLPGDVIAVNQPRYTLGALQLRGFMGFGWSTPINCMCSMFNLQVGYEVQYWFNQLRIPTFQQFLLHGDLVMQGITLNCQVDF